jgi:hypothetical protein
VASVFTANKCTALVVKRCAQTAARLAVLAWLRRSLCMDHVNWYVSAPFEPQAIAATPECHSHLNKERHFRFRASSFIMRDYLLHWRKMPPLVLASILSKRLVDMIKCLAKHRKSRPRIERMRLANIGASGWAEGNEGSE